MFKKIYVKLAIFLCVAIMFQLTVLPYFTILGVQPDLGVSIFISMVLLFPHVSLLLFAFFIGIVEDLFFNGYFGMRTMMYLFSAFTLSFFINRLDFVHVALRAVLFFCFALLAFFAELALNSILSRQLLIGPYEIFYIICRAFYTMFTSLAMYAILKRYYSRRLKQYELF
jgi:rod shape-determining protein MreD